MQSSTCIQSKYNNVKENIEKLLTLNYWLYRKHPRLDSDNNGIYPSKEGSSGAVRNDYYYKDNGNDVKNNYVEWDKFYNIINSSVKNGVDEKYIYVIKKRCSVVQDGFWGDQFVRAAWFPSRVPVHRTLPKPGGQKPVVFRLEKKLS